MRIIFTLIFIFMFSTFSWAEKELKTEKIKEEITYPTRDTAVRKGKTYRLMKASEIYEVIDRAKDLKEKPGEKK